MDCSSAPRRGLNVEDLVVIHHAKSGATYNRAEQYTGGQLSQSPGNADFTWTGIFAKNPSKSMKGRLLRTTDMRWRYFEELFDKGRLEYSQESICNIDAGSSATGRVVTPFEPGKGNAPPRESSKSEDAAEWKWGLREVEDYDSRGNQKRTRQAAVAEYNGRGVPLMILSCSGSTLDLVDGPEEGYWISEPMGKQGQQVGCIKIQGIAEVNEPILFRPGQDGYYFQLDLDGVLSDLKNASSFYICPAENAQQNKCRMFMLRRFKEAVRFVCHK